MPDILTQINLQGTAIIGAAIIAALILQFVQAVHFLAYPFRLFITIIHELSHGFAAILTGGEFSQFIVRLDTSGIAWRRGGWDFVVTPAGYLGTTLLSALLIVFTTIEGAASLVLGSLGAFIISSAIIFGWRSLTTLFTGLGSGMGAVFIAGYTHEHWALFFISLLAVFGCLDAFFDLQDLAFEARLGIPSDDDAAKMATRFGGSVIFWTWVWTITSLLIVGWAIWFAWLRSALT